MDFVVADLYHRRVRVGAQGQHLALNTLACAAFTELINDLFDAAHRVGQIGFEKMEYTHFNLLKPGDTRAR